MSDELLPNSSLRAGTLDLDGYPLASADVVSGAPRTSIRTLLANSALEVGVWEITPGVVTDTEVDEVFVVLSGSAIVEFEDGGGMLHLSAGSTGRFDAGTRTRWTVTDTLRKVYVTGTKPDTEPRRSNQETA